MPRPAGDCFDSEWRRRSVVEACSVSEITDMLAQHYLRRRPGTVVFATRLLVECFGRGCLTFSLPPRETSVRYGGETLELSRLWVADDVPANAETYMIARSVRLLRKAKPSVRFLVSYADPSAGHAGTIYLAAGWKRDGRTDEGRKTPRFDMADAATGKVYHRAAHAPHGVALVRKPRISKHRFVLQIGTDRNPRQGERPA